MNKELDIQDLAFLADCFHSLNDEELLESLHMCTPLQTELIINHINLIGDNMMIGYHKTDNRVFILNIDDDSLLEITKNKDNTKGKKKSGK